MAPAAKRARGSYDAYITVAVGKEERQFIVHEGIIVSHSRFFKAACNGKFKEAKDRIVRLPEEEPAEIETYVHWLYEGAVRTSALDALEDTRERGEFDKMDPGSKQDCFRDLAKIYRIADRLEDCALRNAVTDRVIKLQQELHTFPGAGYIHTAYSATAEGSTLRRLVVDFWASQWKTAEDADAIKKWLRTNRNELHHDFIFDLAVARRPVPERPSWKRRCDYHQHEEGTPQCV